MAANQLISTTKSPNPLTGEMYLDLVDNKMYVYIGTKWHQVYPEIKSCMEKISKNQFTCASGFSLLIDSRINQVDLKSVKKSRKFDKVLYTIEDEVELNIFNVYFSESIK
jgi:hypothetical protein